MEYIPQNVDCIVNIDENGTGNLKKVLQAVKTGVPLPDSEKHFALTACLIHTRDFAAASEAVMSLKRRYWPDAMFCYGGKLKRVCFHSNEIRGHKGAFHPSVIDYDSFIVELSQLIATLPITVYAAHIDKVRHASRYIWPDSPYDLCMNFVLERIMRDIGPNERCVVVLESRGKQEDMQLLDQIKHLIDHGNRYNPASRFSKISGVYFNPKWSSEALCQKSYWALEIADVCSYPVYKFFAHGKRDKAFDVVETKFKSFPHYRGKGLKTFP